MNIFEKYGGYEAVKQAAVNYKNSGDRVTAAGLELQCLEYRRQHNIFEEGDWVVIPSRGNGIFQVSRLLCRSDVQEMIHATDEEIKAGKRLPD